MILTIYKIALLIKTPQEENEIYTLKRSQSNSSKNDIILGGHDNRIIKSIGVSWH